MVENMSNIFSFLNNRENYFENEKNSPTCNYFTLEKYKELESIYSLCNLSLVNFNTRSFSNNNDSFNAVLCSMIKCPDFIVFPETWNNFMIVHLCNLEALP